jgi:hypothetical protein
VLTAWPNPLRDEVVFHFDVPIASFVELSIWDASGRRRATPWRGFAQAGPDVIRWNGRDDAGRKLPQGVYLAKLSDRGRELVRKVIVLE